jgi:organic hydroperoxide reductase OsmC/OhrA
VQIQASGSNRPVRIHPYRVHLRWTGAGTGGTSGYTAYSRDHVLSASGKPELAGSSDPVFRGDKARWSPEELLLGAISACHQLWYLHVCAEAGITVFAYEDDPHGEMHEYADGSGQFMQATLRPAVIIAAGCDVQVAHALHADAHAKCFVARSVNFPIHLQPAISTEDTRGA